MMRGTVWLMAPPFELGGVMIVSEKNRSVFEFDVETETGFKLRAGENGGYDVREGEWLEFGPIGPPWRKA